MNIKFDSIDNDLSELNWHKHSGGYAYRWFMGEPKPYKELAHRIVLRRKLGRPLRKGELTDHINRDKLDNRRSNLRAADKSLNTINRAIRPDNTTGYVGVYLFWPKQYQERKWAKRWVARIERYGKIHHVGYYKTPLEAHKARQRALKALAALG